MRIFQKTNKWWFYFVVTPFFAPYKIKMLVVAHTKTNIFVFLSTYRHALQTTISIGSRY